MHVRKLTVTLGLALAVPLGANAQSVKAGLWEYSSRVGGLDPAIERQMKEAQDQMARMPPEQRRMMEQMMGQMGVGIGGKPNSFRVCISPEQARTAQVPVSDEDCSYTIKQRSASRLTMTFECRGDDPSRGDVEVTFKGDSGYDMKSNVITDVDGKPTRVQVDTQARWVAASCGSIKPVGQP